MVDRRTFLLGAGAAIAAPALAWGAGSETLTFGPMQARYVGEFDGIHRWAYRSRLMDTIEDMNAPEEYLIDVVLPDTAGGPYPILFVGEVNASPGTRGYGLALARQENIHNTYGCILVSSTYKSMPWYGRHADGSRAFDAHIIRSVFPLVERMYDGATDREGKLFIGFSKSGWGALSLILRNPDHFGYAAAWDSPWDYTWSNRSIVEAFGTEARFNAYDPKQILAVYAASINDRERVWVSAGRTFNGHHAPMIQRLVDLEIPHRARFLPVAEHQWSADWMNAGCSALFDMRAAK